MSRVKFLLFLIFAAGVSQAKVARQINYDAESVGEDQPMMELLDMDFVTEDKRLDDTIASLSGKMQEDNRRKARMSDELFDVLKNAKSFQEVKRYLDHQSAKRVEDDTVEKREEVSISTSLKCPVPRSTTVHTTHAGSKPAIKLVADDFSWFKDSPCIPRPMAVRLDPPANGMYYPSYAILHRCAGSCGYLSPTIHQCEVNAEQEVKYRVYQISYTTGLKLVEVKVMNHTGCACGCVLKSHHCDPNVMKYNQDYCRCDCIKDESSCDPSIQKWNTASCQCQCKFPASHCADRNKSWSTTTCACECIQSKKDECRQANKQINTSDCSCV